MNYFLPPRSDPIKGFSVAGNTCNPGTILNNPEANISLEALGKGKTVRESLLAYLGETVERYQLFVGDPTSKQASYAELCEEFPMVDLKYLQFYSDHERKRIGKHVGSLDKLNRTEERSWVEGTNLVTGSKTYLPLELVLNKVGEGNRPICPPTTNGLACHESTTKALLSSLYECIERDAFVETWFTKKTPSRLHTDKFELENNRLKLNLLEFDSKIDIPTIGCLGVLKKRKSPFAFICGSANNSLQNAIQTSLWEASQSWSWMCLKIAGSSTNNIDPKTISDLKENVLYYTDPNHSHNLDFLLNGQIKSVKLDDDSGNETDKIELLSLIKKLESINVSPIAFDITTPEIEEIGLVVTRVVIPELLPLPLPSFPFDAHPKLKGLIENHQPHPYP